MNSHKLSPRFFIAAPVEQSLRLQHVLLSLGECRVYTDPTDLKPAECDAIFSCGQISPELKKWLGAATPPVVTLLDASTSQANPANGLVLKTEFYYQDVLEVLYRLQLGRERGAVLINEPLVGVSSAVAELRRLSARGAVKAVPESCSA